MDNQPKCLPQFVLEMKINCCKSCPKKLKEWMGKITGVNSVAVEPEKKLVYVTGKIEPEKLIKKIYSKFKKKATLYEQKTTTKDEKKDDDKNVENKNARSSEDKNVKNKNVGRDGSDSDDDESRPQSNRNRAHKAEPYFEHPRVAVDEGICGDKFCMFHHRDSIVRNGQNFMSHPISRRGPMPQPPPPPYSMDMPPPPPPSSYPTYGYRYPPPPPPPPPPSSYAAYGYYYPPPPPQPMVGYDYPRRPFPAIDYTSDYFNDEDTRGCSIM